MGPETRIEQTIGSVLPDVTLASVVAPHDTWRLHEHAARGRGAVIVFWSSVCSHCARYDDYLNRFTEKHPELAFAAIASRQNETPDDIRKALTTRGLGFVTLHDEGMAVARELFTQQTPRAFLVDAASRLLYRGAIDNFKYPEDSEYEAYLEPAIDAMLAGRPVARPEVPSFGCAIQSIYYTIPRPLRANVELLKIQKT
jgi:thiol-disulfide isomerase/thioredoxin